MNTEQFDGEVFPAEQEEIIRRRQQQGQDTDAIKGPPSVDQELAGLALSGGGIRSATFALGVIQGLARHGWLGRMDYLSTVSGGGYIGSCVSALLNDPANKPDGEQFPLKYSAGRGEPPALTHLRNSSNYLNPGSLLDKLRLPNLLLRGVLLNLFVFLPYLMLAVFATEVAYKKLPDWDQLPGLILPMIILFGVMALAFPIAIRVLGQLLDWRRRNAYELWLTVPLLIAIVLLALVPVLNLTQVAIEHNLQQIAGWIVALEPEAKWRGSAVVLGVIGVFMLAGAASENVAKLRGKVLLLLVGLMGPMVIFGTYLVLCLWQIESPFLPHGASVPLTAATRCSEPCLNAESQTAIEASEKHSFRQIYNTLTNPEQPPQNFAQLMQQLQGRQIDFYSDAEVTCLTDAVTQPPARPGQPVYTYKCSEEPVNYKTDKRVWVVRDNWRDSDDPDRVAQCPTLEQLEHNTNPWVAQNCTYFVRHSDHMLRIKGANLELFSNPRDWWFLATFIALILFNRFFLDVNTTSPHGFYRDRLSKAFLFRFNDEKELEQTDKLKLTELNGTGTAAPYHIINVALNLQSSKDPGVRGRMSDFFEFAKRFTGGDRTGYAQTGEVEKYDRHLNLGTAMAVSGAAAAPNMGATTNRSLVFIMTLLNIRLGYWLPNPANVNRKYWHKGYSLSGAKPALILKEALGRVDASGSHVNISDGGHIENLAIYPLLKRRCRFIVAVDGEADPTMQFGGLVTLMRYARIDMGVEIDIDLDGLRKHYDGTTHQHWAMGTIRYGDGQVGHLLYLKLSVTGDEPEYVRAYRSAHPDYPHESTADQFFAEDQFEAYRALGEHVCEGMLADPEKLGEFRRLGSTDRA